MKKFVIERNVPNVGNLTEEELKGASQGSNQAIQDMDHQVQWVQSYVTGDKVYCVYLADNEEALRQHAQRAGVPADQINEVITVSDPTTAGS